MFIVQSGLKLKKLAAGTKLGIHNESSTTDQVITFYHICFSKSDTWTLLHLVNHMIGIWIKLSIMFKILTTCIYS